MCVWASIEFLSHIPHWDEPPGIMDREMGNFGIIYCANESTRYICANRYIIYQTRELWSLCKSLCEPLVWYVNTSCTKRKLLDWAKCLIISKLNCDVNACIFCIFSSVFKCTVDYRHNCMAREKTILGELTTCFYIVLYIM